MIFCILDRGVQIVIKSFEAEKCSEIKGVAGSGYGEAGDVLCCNLYPNRFIVENKKAKGT